MTNFEEPKPRGRMAAKDWVSILISCMAIAVSISTAYFSVILQQDDIRVVFGHHPHMYIEDGTLSISGAQQFTFINSGNRTAAISGLGGLAWLVSESESEKRDCEREGNPTPPFYIGFDTNPFVLKPGEISVVTAALKDMWLFWTRRKDGSFYIPKSTYLAKAGHIYFVCLTLNLVTPDSYSVQWRTAAYKFVVPREGFSDFKKKAFFDTEKPMIVLQRTSTVFSRYLP